LHLTRDTPAQGDVWEGLPSNSLLPHRFRSSALSAPPVRVGLPTSHVAAKAMHTTLRAGYGHSDSLNI
jgi:hypothetical protein